MFTVVIRTGEARKIKQFATTLEVPLTRVPNTHGWMQAVRYTTQPMSHKDAAALVALATEADLWAAAIKA